MATTTSSNESQDTQIVSEIPEALNRALLLAVKNFYSKEHFIVVYYIMRAVCIKEDSLRLKLQFDQKQLRQVLAPLKSEKLVRERLVQQKNDSGRSVSLIFYFINYRAIINVLKYKIDHLRQRLEAKEKDNVQRTQYRCEKCGSMYGELDVSTIFDMASGTFKCWRCHGNVAMEQTGGPTQSTRNRTLQAGVRYETLLAQFNEQMLPLFSLMKQLAGIQLAPHLLEPDINKYLADEERAAEQSQQVDFSSDVVSNARRAQLGGVAHSYAANQINYDLAESITVDLNADSTVQRVEEKKEVPLWLQDDAIGGGGEQRKNSATDGETSEGAEQTTVSMNMLAELEGLAETPQEPPEKKIKTEEPTTESEEDDGEEETVTVAGREVPLSEVTPDMVLEMTEDEKTRYTSLLQSSYDFY